MEVKTLKRAVEQIELGEDKQKQMIRALEKRKGTRRSQAYGLRAAAALAVCITAAGILSIPVRALVSSLVRERMEEMPQEELAVIVEQIDSQRVGGDGYTRSYTEAEKVREKELYEQYVNGTFPEGEIPQADSEAEAQEYEFCYLTTASVFYLPVERELTDEEILEKIDFEYRRNYALQERQAGMTAEKKAAEKEQIAQAVEAGGITEEQAVETATAYFERIYGLDGDNLELNHYYDAEASVTVTGEEAYCVNWSDMPNRQYYYFWISVADGSVLGIEHSGAQLHEQFEAVKPDIDEASDRVAGIKEQAERFLADKMELRETYDKIRSCYQITGEGGISAFVDVLFVKADGTACMVECGWDGTVNGYSVTTEEMYEEKVSKYREVMTKRYTEEFGREVTVKNVWY